MPVNSQAPILANSVVSPNTSTKTIMDTNRMIPVRVIDVSLTPSSNGKSTFQLTNGWFGIGAIKFEPLTNDSTPNEFPQGNIAYPMNINYRNLPLINEIVYVTLGPSLRKLTEGNSDSLDFYYTSTLNVWNGVHTNPLPSPNNLFSNTNTVSDQNIADGIENNKDNKLTEVSYGRIFKENEKIRNLYPQEGDVIIEGRFGNSLRFTSTNKQPSGSTDIQSPWSTSGTNGTPLTILRNGQYDVGFNRDNWFPIFENIQGDASSIYLTAGQAIPVALATRNFASFGIDAVPQIDTTERLQRVDLENTKVSAKEADSTGSIYDTINQEPDLSTEVRQQGTTSNSIVDVIPQSDKVTVITKPITSSFEFNTQSFDSLLIREDINPDFIETISPPSNRIPPPPTFENNRNPRPITSSGNNGINNDLI
jgi:hypothetical protein